MARSFNRRPIQSLTKWATLATSGPPPIGLVLPEVVDKHTVVVTQLFPTAQVESGQAIGMLFGLLQKLELWILHVLQLLNVEAVP
jgi:hypothetical protein